MQYFERIRKEIAEDYAADRAANAGDIFRRYENLLREYSTARRWEQFQAGEITREKAIEYAAARRARELDRREAQDLERLASYEAAPEPTYISILVSYSRYGVCHVEALIDGEVFRGRASGGNYSLADTAIAGALNQSASVRGILCALKEKSLAAGIDDSSSTGPRDNRKCCAGLGGYGAIPYFENNGKRHLLYGLEGLGYRFKETACGRTERYLFIRENA